MGEVMIDRVSQAVLSEAVERQAFPKSTTQEFVRVEDASPYDGEKVVQIITIS